MARLGPPFSWEKFSATAAKIARDGVPHPRDASFDSLRAVALSTSGRFAAGEVLEVWTNDHIERLVDLIAQKSQTPDRRTGDRGLGWDAAHARTLIDDLIGTLTETSNGGTLGAHFPDSNPPLDHEDGMVYGACRSLTSEDPVCEVYCVTRDRQFLEAYDEGRLSGHTRVLRPSTFVQLVRGARARYSVGLMRP